ncbi:hypothetical protein DL98DRAFT_549272 [Cadophora sp. DSE1049]|nr:hypothetical protein DL98DRAFT_549272 [Cadophora sp. DSE1049]
MQPETRPIIQEQLVAEVKGIYAGLGLVEAKCIEVDNKQSICNLHHDFFLASQHPSASLGLRRLASKYAMPARMWRLGIYSFLEISRLRLLASLDNMLAFIYLVYSMMALLHETVPVFEDTWIECLGDLDREVWTWVARQCYSKAADNAPTTGRFYHHLAIFARPNGIWQLFYYANLISPTPASHNP